MLLAANWPYALSEVMQFVMSSGYRRSRDNNSLVEIVDKPGRLLWLEHAIIFFVGLFQSGVDIAVIALWLGDGSIETTHGYVEVDFASKQKAWKSWFQFSTNCIVISPKMSCCNFFPGSAYSACDQHENHVSSPITAWSRNNPEVGIT
jgi:hypothetical protein